MLITQALAGLALSLIVLMFDPSVGLAPTPVGAEPAPLPEGFGGDLLLFFGVVFGGSLLIALVQSVGWAAGTLVVTRWAVGQPVGLAAALGYGVRRAPGLWGWTLLSTLIITAGVCLCFVPAIYFAFALSLVGPVYLFERGNPIARSFRFLHSRPGLVLGRVAVIAALVVGGSLAGSLIQAVGLVVLGIDPIAATDLSVGVVLVHAVVAVLTVPVYLGQLIGLVLTYAEQRAYEAPVNAPRLAAELG